MGFGGTTQKLQKVASMAEDVYEKLNELREQIQAMRETVERVDRRTAENRALLEAIAAEQDLDVDAALTETAIEEAENVESASEADGEGVDEPTTGAEGDSATADGTAETPSTDDATDGTTDASVDRNDDDATDRSD